MDSMRATKLTWSKTATSSASCARDEGRPVINPIVYAEVSTGSERIEDLDETIPASDFEREPLPCHAALGAGKAFLTYCRRGGARLSPLPDFYIGAHAAVAGYRLPARDASRFRAYFPSVQPHRSR